MPPKPGTATFAICFLEALGDFLLLPNDGLEGNVLLQTTTSPRAIVERIDTV